MIDRVSAVYVENKTKFSWSIRKGTFYEEKK